MVVFLTDQLRADALGCYGHPLAKTPHIDGLAAAGARFTNAYCTTPLCSPARASILSGVYPHRHGIVDLWGKIPSFRGPVPGWPNPSPQELPWIGEMLQQAGYETAYAGKWHCLTGGERRGFQQVMARYGDFDIDSPEQNEFTIYATGKRYKLTDLRGHGEDFVPQGYNYGTSLFAAEDYRDTFIVRKACEYLQRPHHRPFCLFISILAPHDPYAPPKPFDSMYPAGDIPLPPNVDVFTNVRRPIPLRGHPKDLAWCRGASKDEIREAWAHYLGSVTYLDGLVGSVIGTLEKTNRRSDTLFVFTSDHGDALGSHRVENKGAFMYDSVTRVPLIVNFPGSIKPQSVSAPTSQVSILPTLLGFAAISDTVTRDGPSWKEALTESRSLPSAPVFCEYNRFYGEHFPVRSIIAERYKYVHYFGPDGELFDRQQDPYEMENLMYAPDRASDLRKLRRELFRHLISSGDPYAALLSRGETALAKE